MSELLFEIRRFCQEYRMIPEGGSVLVCVSGGTDSMCLLDALYKLSGPMGFTLHAAHFNHRLRGAESDGDEAFVREACDHLGVPLTVGAGDVAAEAARRKKGIEETARELRYAFFFRTAGELRLSQVAVAHNADDDLETVLMRLTRGTGLRGLGGIPPVWGKLIRPLLGVTRAEIQAYNEENGVAHREDSTNLEDGCTRNILRHRVVPVLRELNPALRVTDMTALLREDEAVLEGLAREFLAGQEEGTLDCGALLALPRPVAARAVRRFCHRELERAHVEAVLALAGSKDPSARVSLPGMGLRREYGRIVVDGGEEESSFQPFDAPLDKAVIIEEAELIVSGEKTVFQGGIYNSLTTFPIKWDKIVGKLTVRPRRTGDAIRLGGMSRSLKKLLIDRKIPRARRALLPVIADGRGVIAVYGVGMDRDYRPEEGAPAIIIKIEERTKHA